MAVLVVGAAPARSDPPAAVRAALAHARSLPPDPDRQLRFLDLSHVQKDKWADWIKALSFHLNSLSRSPDLIRPRVLEGGWLLAVDLRDYEIDRLVYGRLASVDPYFHVQVELADARGKKTRQSAHAPWLPAAEVVELARLCNSSTPVLRGDWFLYQTAVQKDRAAGYYDFLGLGKREADFERLIGANPAESKRLRLELAASVARSTVALHNRGIFRQQSLTGGHWTTLDFKTSTDKQNTARLLHGDPEPPQGDASEQYGVLPNRLFAYWLQDAKGNRQDTAPDDIASDGKSTSNDRRVHPMLSCVRCHVEGLRPVDDYVRRLYQAPLELRSPDYERLRRLRQLYFSDLPGQQAEDNARYAGALAAVNGLRPAENARLYASAWESYVDEPVWASTAAAELGVSAEVFLAKIRAYAQSNPLIDPVIAVYAQAGPPALRREHFEEVYAQLQEVMRSTP